MVGLLQLRFERVLGMLVCVNYCSGRRRSFAAHNSIRASPSPSLCLKIKSTPLSCVSRVHTTSRRSASTQYTRHSPWICKQCLSMSSSQHGAEPTAMAPEVGRAMQEQSRVYDGRVCVDDSGCRLLSDEMYTPRRKLRQSESLLRPASQQHHTGGISPSRTVLLLDAN